MPVSLEVALWIVMVGAIVVGLWPSNLIGYAERGAERRWHVVVAPVGSSV